MCKTKFNGIKTTSGENIAVEDREQAVAGDSEYLGEDQSDEESSDNGILPIIPIILFPFPLFINIDTNI